MCGGGAWRLKALVSRRAEPDPHNTHKKTGAMPHRVLVILGTGEAERVGSPVLLACQPSLVISFKPVRDLVSKYKSDCILYAIVS